MKVTTNNHRRELLALAELAETEREQFDYVTEDDAFDPRFVRAYGNVYDVHDSQAINTSQFQSFGFNVSVDSELASWHGITTESAFSAWAFARIGKVWSPRRINQQSNGEGTAPPTF